jgi:hypothetical protein
MIISHIRHAERLDYIDYHPGLVVRQIVRESSGFALNLASPHNFGIRAFQPHY